LFSQALYGKTFNTTAVAIEFALCKRPCYLDAYTKLAKPYSRDELTRVCSGIPQAFVVERDATLVGTVTDGLQ